MKPAGRRRRRRRHTAKRSLLDRRQRTAKRIFDLAFATSALLVLWPLMLVIAVLVRRSSPGPALYRHARIGRNGIAFDVLKFRTMYTDASRADWQVTVSGDPRVTPMGRRLRATKFDELPQLWNVVRGEMSLVGPRPDVAGYVDRLSGPEASLLRMRPGITGLASLYLRNEEELLGTQDDPRRYYDEVLFPLKVRLELEYFQTWQLSRDVGVLAVTAIPALDRWLRVVPRPGDHR